jgi:hypothetical protein
MHPNIAAMTRWILRRTILLVLAWVALATIVLGLAGVVRWAASLP